MQSDAVYYLSTTLLRKDISSSSFTQDEQKEDCMRCVYNQLVPHSLFEHQLPK